MLYKMIFIIINARVILHELNVCTGNSFCCVVAQSNVKLQEELNSNRGNSPIGDQYATAWYGINKFSDLSPQEFSGKSHYY